MLILGEGRPHCGVTVFGVTDIIKNVGQCLLFSTRSV